MTFSSLLRLRQILLAIPIAYFYAVAFFLEIGSSNKIVMHPFAFLMFGLLFLCGLLLELYVTWWHKRRRLVWWGLAIASYGIIGLGVAPTLYGSWVIPFVLLAPLSVVFIVGFAYVYSHLMYIHFFLQPLDEAQIKLALRSLPGWSVNVDRLEKTFLFKRVGQPRMFDEGCQSLAKHMHCEVAIELKGQGAVVRVRPPEGGGLTQKDLDLAHLIDQLA